MGSIDPPKSPENDSTPTSDGGHHHHLTGNRNHPSPDFAVAQPENETYRKRKASMLPLEVGTRVLCRWRDSKYHPVKVIERRRLHCGGPNDYEYYVHYTECETFSFLWSILKLLGLGLFFSLIMNYMFVFYK